MLNSRGYNLKKYFILYLRFLILSKAILIKKDYNNSVEFEAESRMIC